MADDAIRTAVAAMPELRAAALKSGVAESGAFTVVTLRYDAGHLPLMQAGLVPMPPALIERRAVVRHGGFP
jgi:hypothetical protein